MGPQVGEIIYCKVVDVYAGQLVYGEGYCVTACDRGHHMVRIKNSQGRLRKYHWGLFSRRRPPRVQVVEIDPADWGCWEVNVQMADGQWRWIVAATPEVLGQVLHNYPYFSCPHLLVVRTLDSTTLVAAVRHLLHQGDLMSGSRTIAGYDGSPRLLKFDIDTGLQLEPPA